MRRYAQRQLSFALEESESKDSRAVILMLKLMETVLSKISAQINGIERRTLLIEETVVTADHGRSNRGTLASVDETEAHRRSNSDLIAPSTASGDVATPSAAASPAALTVMTAGDGGAAEGGGEGGGGEGEGKYIQGGGIQPAKHDYEDEDGHGRLQSGHRKENDWPRRERDRSQEGRSGGGDRQSKARGSSKEGREGRGNGGASRLTPREGRGARGKGEADEALVDHAGGNLR